MGSTNIKATYYQGYTINQAKIEKDPNFLVEFTSIMRNLAQKQINNDDFRVNKNILIYLVFFTKL